MKKVQLKEEILHVDETPVTVLAVKNEKGSSKRYMWVSTSGRTGKGIVLYHFGPGRGKSVANAILKGYKGFIHTDGYEVYHNLSPDITVVGCIAHARRKWKEALNLIPKEHQEKSEAFKGFSYCNALFSIEKDFISDKTTDIDYENIYIERLEKSSPIIDAYFEWVKNLRDYDPKSKLGAAIKYSINQEKYLRNYLLDGRLELSNNRGERSIRPFAIGRNNWKFYKTSKGAEVGAILYSLIESAKANDINPLTWLTYLFDNIRGEQFLLEKEELLEPLMPWNENIKEKFKSKK